MVQLKGVEETIRHMKDFANDVQKEIIDGMDVVTGKVLADGKHIVPVRTGALKESGRRKVTRKRVWFTGTVGFYKKYAYFVEFGCFLNKQTKILTKRGWVKIEHIKIEDKVLTHKNNWKSVKAIYTFNEDKKLDLGKSYTIKIAKGYKIGVTANHPIMTQRGWVRADKLTLEDKVQIVYNNLPHFHWKNFSNIHPRIGRRFTEYVTLKCANCGVTFEKPKSYLKFHNNNKFFYCSRDCYKQKTKKINFTCAKCGKIFERTEGYLKFHKDNKYFYCNKDCSYTSRKNEKNANYGLKHLKMHTKEFKEKMSQRMVNKNNPMFNKERNYYYSRLGYREDLGLTLRSTWEANLIRIFKYKGVKFEYEPEHFDLDNLGSWTPDFKIQLGTKEYFIEVKGYANKKFRQKLGKFKRLYNKHLLIIDESRYRKLENKFANSIKEWEFGSASIKGANLKFDYDEVISISKWKAGHRLCYNISVEDDESFVSNHIVTHNTRFMSARPYLWPAVTQNREFILKKLGRHIDHAIEKNDYKHRILRKRLI